MKVYIVFLGFLIVAVMAITYQGDLGEFTHEQLVLKEAAEECAAGAALYIEEGAFAEGKIVFDSKAGEKYAQEYLEYIKRNSKALSVGTVRWKMEFEDDQRGYSTSNTQKIPAVTINIFVQTGDLFRVPFIEVKGLERSARYELPEEWEK